MLDQEKSKFSLAQVYEQVSFKQCLAAPALRLIIVFCNLDESQVSVIYSKLVFIWATTAS